MLDWRVVWFYLALLALILLSGKPIWWLPVVSFAFLVLTFPRKRSFPAFDWHHWHPVFSSLSAALYPSVFSRWVRYRKIIGGDSLLVIPTQRENGLLLLDLSKNDIDTFLQFVWTRALLARSWGKPRTHFLRLLEVIRQFNDRVDLSYLLGFLNLKEAEWHGAGCFGVGWFSVVAMGQRRILPTLGRTFWRVRRTNTNWVFTTDGLATHIDEVIEAISRDGSPEKFIQDLPRQDDLTIGWFAPKLNALSGKEVTELR
ncbi:MAG: hypothetical protein N3B10_14680 [Armatimonadetes bacterium]|nr:hypothetical protein [Armatimonadota bacterium]